MSDPLDNLRAAWRALIEDLARPFRPATDWLTVRLAPYPRETQFAMDVLFALSVATVVVILLSAVFCA